MWWERMVALCALGCAVAESEGLSTFCEQVNKPVSLPWGVNSPMVVILWLLWPI